MSESLYAQKLPDYEIMRSLNDREYHLYKNRLCVRARRIKDRLVIECPVCSKYVDRELKELSNPFIVHHVFDNPLFENEPMEEEALYDCGPRNPLCNKHPFGQKKFLFHLYFIPSMN